MIAERPDPAWLDWCAWDADPDRDPWRYALAADGWIEAQPPASPEPQPLAAIVRAAVAEALASPSAPPEPADADRDLDDILAAVGWERARDAAPCP